MDGVEPDDGVKSLQIPFTPCLKLWDQLVCDRIQRPIGETYIIQLLDMMTDVLITVAQSKQGNNFAFQFIRQLGLMLSNNLGFERPSRSRGVSSSNAPEAVFMVFSRSRFSGWVATLPGGAAQFCFHGSFGKLFDEWREDSVLTGGIFAILQGLKGCFHVKCWGSHKSSLFG